MCGIAAIVADRAHRHAQALQQMSDALAHRGPDGQGSLNFASCLLGHRRLTIVDLKTGQQPMLSFDRKVAVTYNGELYSFHEDKHKFNYPYSTNSDTELLLASYFEHGIEMCESLRGMFAFAIWDEREQRLFCARDRFGEKPLYYALSQDGTFLVASEIKALLASGLLKPRLNRQAVSAYFKLGYVPEHITIFENIQQVRPGYYLIFQNGKITTKPYWLAPAVNPIPPSEEEAIEEFRFLLKKSVHYCLTADVDLGILLSGGLDSTTIALLASQEQQLSAFAFGMQAERNELPFARAVAKDYNLPLKEVLEDEMDFVALLSALPQIYDEPLLDSSCLPTVLLSRRVSQDVKTVLAGDGADELLGGYLWYDNLEQEAQKVQNVPENYTAYAYAFLQRRQICSDTILREASLDAYLPELPVNSKYSPLANSLDDVLRMDLAGFLVSDILRKTDRASMACGLEIRAPFLDVDLANFLLSLPYHFKLDKQNNKKILLRKAYQEQWSELIKTRPKQGFGMLTYKIMHDATLQEFFQSLLYDKNLTIYGLFPEKWLLEYTKKLDALTWAIFIFSLWCEDLKKQGYVYV